MIAYYQSRDAFRLIDAERIIGASGYTGRAELLLQLSKPREAASELNRSIQIWPAHDNYAYCVRARAHYLDEQSPLGLLDSDKCVRNFPNSFMGWATRGSLLDNTGDVDAAIADYTRALQFEQPSWVLSARAFAYLRREKFYEALTDYSAAISRDRVPEAANYIERGRALFGLKQWADAARDFTQALTIDAKLTEALEWRSRAHFMIGKPDDSLADIERVLKSEPNAPAALIVRGILYEAHGSIREAAADYDGAVKSAPRALHRERDLQAQRYAEKRLEELASAVRSEAEKEKGGRGQSGSGFFVSTDGHVLTNAHVIEGCKAVSIHQPGGRNEVVGVVATDRTNDLALLRATRTSSIGQFNESVRTGDPIATFGFPFAGVLPSSGNFSLGNVSATTGLGDDSRMFQVSAPVQAGNSGGPLMDHSGNIVGVVVAKLNAVAMLRASGDLPQNVNFAIKSSVARTFLSSNGVNVSVGVGGKPLAPADLADRAKSFTVFIQCRE